MYSLFIDTLSSPAFICLFDDERIIRDSFSWEGKHAEFNTLIESIDSLLKRNAQTFSEIAKIICIVGPGGFTGIRVTTLVANTIGYSFGVPLYPVTVSEFFQAQRSPLPWILALTKTEVLMWTEAFQSSPLITRMDSLHSLSTYSSIQFESFLGEQTTFIQANNYETFLKNFIIPEKVTLLRPLYARDPNVGIKK